MKATKNRGVFLALAVAKMISLPTLAFGQSAPSVNPATHLKCDETLKDGFKPDTHTTVILVKAFRKGDVLTLKDGPSNVPFASMGSPAKAPNDLCLVKLVVGPGNPGPADAPSTSPGIGIEVWLPALESWNGRIHSVGGGGFVGGPAGSPVSIAWVRAGILAGTEGAVSSYTNTGHEPSDGSWGLNPDGTIAKPLWVDFAGRAIHEQAAKTKALATAYYGRSPRYSYFEGASTGGRQGHKLAQDYPDDYDGIIANLGALYWSRFSTGMFYNRLVIERDLAGKMPTNAQLDLVSNAAIKSCDVVGGQHLGYIMDTAKCRYDPSRDFMVLCRGEGGQNDTADCVTRRQAKAINKIWYGITADGSVPDPAVDNGWDQRISGKRRWFGYSRGTSLYNNYFSRLAAMVGADNPPAPLWKGDGGLAADWVAIVLQDPAMAGPKFRNSKMNGAAAWKNLTYRELDDVFNQGVAFSSHAGELDTDKPDLSAFRARGGKLLAWHGFNDEAIPVQGSIHYYESVMARMGGHEKVQDFYRLYLIPGGGHMSPQGTSNPNANPPTVGSDQFYEILVNWVEKGIAPNRIEIVSQGDSPVKRTAPICPYPQKTTFVAGDPNLAASFKCLR